MADFNVFKGIEKASNNKSGNHFPSPSHGRVAVKAVKLINSQQKGTSYYIVETKMLKCSDESAVGSDRTWMVDMSKPSALSNVRGFVAAALAMPFDEVGEAEAKGSLETIENGKVTPSELVGVELDYEAIVVKTRAGRDFSKVNWNGIDAGE
jgi:hypothetical protein